MNRGIAICHSTMKMKPLPYSSASFAPFPFSLKFAIFATYLFNMIGPRLLIEKIERFARKFYLNRLIQGVLVGLVLWIVFYLILNGLEYFSWFPPKGRFVLFLVLMLGSVFVLGYYFLIPLLHLIRFRKMMSVEQAAILIGRFFPEIQDKLLNTLQLSQAFQDEKSNSLLVAAIEQRTQSLSPVRFSDAVDLKGNKKYAVVFGALFLLLLALVVFWPNGAVQPAKRIMNYERTYQKPLPFEVRFEQAEIEAIQGGDVRFDIQVVGERIPDAFYVRSDLGQQMLTKVSTGVFYYQFKHLFADLTFQIVGGDYVSPPLKITVHPSPALLSYDCDLHYPAYVHRMDESFSGKTHLLVPQGTVVDFHFHTGNVTEAAIHVDSTCVVLNREDDTWTYRFTAMQSLHFDFAMQNKWMREVDPLPFAIDVVPDAYPDIRVESFSEPLSPDVYYSGLLADDYGFSRLTCNCLIKAAQEKTLVFPVPFDAQQSRTSFYYHFNMDSIGMVQGQEIEVYFEVWDNDGVHGPKSKRSETFSYSKPSEAALDSIAGQSEKEILDRLSEKSRDAADLKDEIEKMLRELTSKKELDWSDKEKVKDLIKRQEDVQNEWNRLQKEQQKLSDFMERNECSNQELLKKQEQINQLFDEVIPEEMKRLMEEMERLLDQMPREKMQQMLQDLKKNNQQMQDLLDRNLALLEQLKVEKDFTDLMDRLEKLGEELQKSSSDNDSTKSADEAKQDFEKMMDELEQLQEKNKTLSDPLDMEKDEQLQEEIEQDLDEASDKEKAGENQDSQSKKQDAGQKMRKMASSMMMQMQSQGQEQLAEDSHLIRVLLENVVRASHKQEALMKDVGRLRTDDPSIPEKITLQKDLSDNFGMVRDSLRSMAKRQTAVQNFIFDELQNIDTQTSLSMRNISELHLNVAVSNQQHALMSMNNLALMLAESLENMENSMNAAGQPSSSSKSKSGKTQSMKQMQQMQEQLGEQLKQLQKQMQREGGKNQSNMSEQMARMAAEQEMLRQGMQQMLDEMKKNGQMGDDGFNDIIKDMEKLEEDIVNKRITNQTLERNREILSRMLESEKAQQKREQEERRKSNEYKGSAFERRIDALYYEQSFQRNQDFLKTSPIEFQPFYKRKINDYYLRKNSQ